MGDKQATHTIVPGLDKQILQSSSNRSTWKSQQTGKVSHTEETGFVSWMVSKHGSPSNQNEWLRSWQHAHNLSAMRSQVFSTAGQETWLDWPGETDHIHIQTVSYMQEKANQNEKGRQQQETTKEAKESTTTSSFIILPKYALNKSPAS